MSAKHPAKSLALSLPAGLRIALRARTGRKGSVADAARCVLERALTLPDPVIGACPAGPGRPVRLQLPRATLAGLESLAKARGMAPAALAAGLLAGALAR